MLSLPCSHLVSLGISFDSSRKRSEKSMWNEKNAYIRRNFITQLWPHPLDEHPSYTTSVKVIGLLFKKIYFFWFHIFFILINGQCNVKPVRGQRANGQGATHRPGANPPARGIQPGSTGQMHEKILWIMILNQNVRIWRAPWLSCSWHQFTKPRFFSSNYLFIHCFFCIEIIQPFKNL